MTLAWATAVRLLLLAASVHARRLEKEVKKLDTLLHGAAHGPSLELTPSGNVLMNKSDELGDGSCFEDHGTESNESEGKGMEGMRRLVTIKQPEVGPDSSFWHCCILRGKMRMQFLVDARIKEELLFTVDGTGGFEDSFNVNEIKKTRSTNRSSGWVIETLCMGSTGKDGAPATNCGYCNVVAKTLGRVFKMQ